MERKKGISKEIPFFGGQFQKKNEKVISVLVMVTVYRSFLESTLKCILLFFILQFVHRTAVIAGNLFSVPVCEVVGDQKGFHSDFSRNHVFRDIVAHH